MTDIFQHSDAPSGKYRCIVEAEGGAVWIYLLDLQENKLLGDAPVCSLAPLLTEKEFKENYRGEGAPPLVAGSFSLDGVIPELDGDRIGFIWDADDSITVTIDSLPCSKIMQGTKRGYSIFITRDGPWGNSWKK